MVIKRFEVWLVNLSPTIGKEIDKTRPCVVVSPNDMAKLSTVLVAPMTSKGFEFPTRLKCDFNQQKGLILLDQLRATDKSRVIKKLGKLDELTQIKLCNLLQTFFAC